MCRIYVDLPDAENRLKILRIFLEQENLESDFQFDKLANATEGYSGSDLKVLCCSLILDVYLEFFCYISHNLLFCRTSVLLQHIDPCRNF